MAAGLLSLGETEMSLTVFLAICVLGCDVLIYFLYEWAFGESKRIRKQRAGSRLNHNAGAQGQSPYGYDEDRAARRRVVDMDRKRMRSAAALSRPNAADERLAYRRLAFAQLKPRT
jgi:hypothetical protein